jgi:hypothetical protein
VITYLLHANNLYIKNRDKCRTVARFRSLGPRVFPYSVDLKFPSSPRTAKRAKFKTLPSGIFRIFRAIKSSSESSLPVRCSKSAFPIAIRLTYARKFSQENH